MEPLDHLTSKETTQKDWKTVLKRIQQVRKRRITKLAECPGTSVATTGLNGKYFGDKTMQMETPLCRRLEINNNNPAFNFKRQSIVIKDENNAAQAMTSIGGLDNRLQIWLLPLGFTWEKRTMMLIRTTLLMSRSRCTLTTSKISRKADFETTSKLSSSRISCLRPKARKVRTRELRSRKSYLVNCKEIKL